jgi:hypothetical protein
MQTITHNASYEPHAELSFIPLLRQDAYAQIKLYYMKDNKGYVFRLSHLEISMLCV